MQTQCGDGTRLSPTLHSGGLRAARTRTLDVWFDNIFTDHRVQQRIRGMDDEVAAARRSVIDLALRLDAAREENASAIEQLGEQRRALLLSASA